MSVQHCQNTFSIIFANMKLLPIIYLILPFLFLILCVKFIETNKLLRCPYDDNRYSNVNKGLILAIEDHKVGVLDRDTLDGVPAAIPNLQSLLIRNTSVKVIAAGSFLYFRNLHCLDLTENEITSVTAHSFWGLRNLLTLIIRRNKLQAIEDATFSAMQNLVKLDLSYNLLSELSDSSFLNLDSLEQLHLDGNRLHFISPLLLSHLSNLRTLTISHNPVLVIDLLSLTSLAYFDASYTHLDRIPVLPNNYITLNLTYSGLHKMPVSFFSRLRYVERMWLEGNDWFCDCQLAWFVQWAEATDKVIDIDQLVCARPITSPKITFTILQEQLNCNQSGTSKYYPIKLPFDAPNVPNSVLDVKLTMENLSHEQTQSTANMEKVLSQKITPSGIVLTQTRSETTKKYVQRNMTTASKRIPFQTSTKMNKNFLFPSEKNLTNVFVHSRVAVILEGNAINETESLYIFEKGKIFERNQNVSDEVYSHNSTTDSAPVLHNSSLKLSTPRGIIPSFASEKLQSLSDEGFNLSATVNGESSHLEQASTDFLLEYTSPTTTSNTPTTSSPTPTTPTPTTRIQRLVYNSSPENPFGPIIDPMKDYEAMLRIYERSGRYFLHDAKNFTEVIPIITKFEMQIPNLNSVTERIKNASKEIHQTLLVEHNLPSENGSSNINHTILNVRQNSTKTIDTSKAKIIWIFIPIAFSIPIVGLLVLFICHLYKKDPTLFGLPRTRSTVNNGTNEVLPISSPVLNYPNWSIPRSDNWTLLRILDSRRRPPLRYLNPSQTSSRPHYSPPPIPVLTSRHKDRPILSSSTPSVGNDIMQF